MDQPIIEDLQRIKKALYVVLDTELPKIGNLVSKWSTMQNINIETIRSAIYI